ncbi:MAG: hypothetical protein K8S21_12820 [Gemmatimonadetes bacterium]|nr:hypothetical protein [Gemmatimonadota bacterium]
MSVLHQASLPVPDGVARRLLTVSAFAVLLAVPGAALPAQAPTAQSITARHDSLVGGRAALEAHRSMRLVGTYAIPDAGIVAPLEILKLRPDKYLFRTTFGPIGEILSGYDGTNAWAVQPGQGAILLEKEMAKQVADQADFFGDLHDLTRFAKVELAEETELEGRRVQRVRMIRASGDTIVEYFDPASGLSAGSLTVASGPLGRSETTTLVGDYKDFGGLKVATRIEQRTPQYRLIISILSVEFDTVDAAAVEPPESVRLLIKP